jgi:hypothetical protein
LYCKGAGNWYETVGRRGSIAKELWRTVYVSMAGRAIVNARIT